MNSSTLLKFGSIMLTAGAIAACGSSSSSSLSSDTYNGPGSKWDVELAPDGTFDIYRRDTPQDLEPNMTVTGDYERYDSGFLGLTVGAASGTFGGLPSAGDQAWALEVPGYALLLKPMGDDKIIAMVSSGSCPTADINANWVIVKKHAGADATDTGGDYFGTFGYDVETGAPTLPSKYSLAGGFAAVTDGGLSGTGTCADGLMFVGETEVAAMYLTQNGGAIVQTNINDEDDSSFIFALAQNEIADIADLQGQYAGMLFDDNMADGSTVNPVSMTCDDAGNCTGTLVSDITTGATTTDSVTVTLNGAVDALGNGFVTGLISDGTGTGQLSCMVDINANGTDKSIVNCVGQSPGENTKMFNVMFVSI